VGLKPAFAHALILTSALVTGACKSRSVGQATAYRGDASLPRGLVKTDKQDMKFEADAAIAKTAADASRDAIQFAKQHFDVVLDGTDSSIVDLERMLDIFYRQKADAGPDEHTISQFGALFGSYVGEVFRKNHGGQWGFITHDDQRFPGMRADRSGQLFWPWGRVQNRISKGPEDNVADYYRIIVRDDVYK
jgi:hypothetical protein